MASPLYIKINISGHQIPALIDTGAQVSLASLDFCQRVGISGLIDARCAGRINGVGSECVVLGRIEDLEVEIAGCKVFMGVGVVDSEGVGVLIGLDFLRRFGCVLDLFEGKMNFRELGFWVEFLGDGELGEMEEGIRRNVAGIELGMREEVVRGERGGKVRKFMEMTDMPRGKSEQLLESSGWDLDTAVQEYFLN